MEYRDSWVSYLDICLEISRKPHWRACQNLEKVIWERQLFWAIFDVHILSQPFFFTNHNYWNYFTPLLQNVTVLFTLAYFYSADFVLGFPCCNPMRKDNTKSYVISPVSELAFLSPSARLYPECKVCSSYVTNSIVSS